jgi:hypothetical protein
MEKLWWAEVQQGARPEWQKDWDFNPGYMDRTQNLQTESNGTNQLDWTMTLPKIRTWYYLTEEKAALCLTKLKLQTLAASLARQRWPGALHGRLQRSLLWPEVGAGVAHRSRKRDRKLVSRPRSIDPDRGSGTTAGWSGSMVESRSRSRWFDGPLFVKTSRREGEWRRRKGWRREELGLQG